MSLSILLLLLLLPIPILLPTIILSALLALLLLALGGGCLSCSNSGPTRHHRPSKVQPPHKTVPAKQGSTICAPGQGPPGNAAGGAGAKGLRERC